MMKGGFKMVGSRNMTPVSREVDESIDRISVMLEQECSNYTSCYDYLTDIHDQASSENPNEHVNESWRRKICEWSYEVIDHFGFDREVVSIALNYLDRVIANKTRDTGASVPRKEFQLAAVTTLYLAIKLHGETDAREGAPRKLRINAFVELSRGLFSVETIETTERSILETLEWRVNPPTSVAFIASLLRLLPETFKRQPVHGSVASSIFEMARYLTELSVCVSSFSFQFKSSEIAYAATLCSIDALRDSVPFPYEVRVAFLNSVAGATALTPNTPSVRKACSMLQELCPSIFDKPEEDVPAAFSRSTSITGVTEEITTEGGKKSPVCVCEVHVEEFIQRKRVRSSDSSE
jgi:lipoyl(octanoyl) transferase